MLTNGCFQCHVYGPPPAHGSAMKHITLLLLLAANGYCQKIEARALTGNRDDSLITWKAPRLLMTNCPEALGDNVTDDTAALQACAVATPQGGDLALSQGKTYLTSSQTAHNGTPCNIFIPHGIHVWGNGSFLRTDPTLSNTNSSTLCLYQAGQLDYESVATHYPTGTINVGDSTITLTTHANAANFAPGDRIWIRGEVVDLNNIGLNRVSSANATTGVLTLYSPVRKTYSTTPVVANAQPYTGLDYAIHDLNFLPGQIQATLATQIDGLVFSNVTIYTTTSVGSEPNQWNYIQNAVVTGGSTVSTFGPLVDFGGRACTNCRLTDYSLSLIPNGTSGPTVTAVNSGEGAEGNIFDSVNITVASGSATGMDISNSTGTVSSNVNIVMGDSATSAAYVTNNGSGAAVSPSFTGGSIQTSASYAAILGASDVDNFANVSITLTGSAAQCIHAVGRANIRGGSCFGMQPGASGVIIEGAGAMGTRVDGVQFKASNTANHAFAVYVVDPGAQQTLDPIIIGNQILGYDTVPIGIQNISHNANLIVCANGAVANAGIGCGH